MACSCDGMMAGCWVSAGVGAGMVVCNSDGVEVMAGCLVVMAGSSWERGAGGGGGGGGLQTLDTCCYMEIRYSYKVPDVLESSFSETKVLYS